MEMAEGSQGLGIGSKEAVTLESIKKETEGGRL